MIFRLIMTHVVLSVIALGLLFGLGYQDKMLSVGVALLLVGINLILVVWSWAKIFAKKSIALAVSVIVFKYALFGVAIYIAVSRQEIDDFWFFIGLTSVVPTMVIVALQNKEQVV